MEAILVAIGAVALAEMGDKTQLLAFLLASRFKKPTPIILGILVATIFNHSLASALGAWITHVFSPEVIKWIIVGSFLAMAAWILIPDKGDDDALKNHSMRFGVFGVTFITFFLAEMGDKTQIATVALTVKYATPVLVVIGTTIGMLIADVPAVWIGDKLAKKFRSNSSALPPQSCLLRSVFWPRLNTRLPSCSVRLSQIRLVPLQFFARRVNFLCDTDRSTSSCQFENYSQGFYFRGSRCLR